MRSGVVIWLTVAALNVHLTCCLPTLLPSPANHALFSTSPSSLVQPAAPCLKAVALAGFAVVTFRWLVKTFTRVGVPGVLLGCILLGLVVFVAAFGVAVFEASHAAVIWMEGACVGAQTQTLEAVEEPALTQTITMDGYDYSCTRV